ncbi:HAMP domain-containing protein [Maribellus comscasis]|uniref:histidine kinase n=1 Tax=Maribellus comscasis TaxID=2681766 RepID=A0A6I6JR70_9BACT|nr:ATP-binding protein [Maribellus comscasis]QGY43699.1 HAMP domain-containing protein [Maribellus comscasis]
MTNMLLKLNKYFFLVLAICLFVSAAIIENGLLSLHPEERLIADFQEQLIADENRLEMNLKDISRIINEDDYWGELNDYLNNNNLLLEKEGVGFLMYFSGELEYWSDRSLSFYDSITQFENLDGFVKLPNGYYLVQSLQVDSADILGLQLIKRNFYYENKYLKNIFLEKYNLPEDYDIIENKTEKLPHIFNKNGEFLFSILPAGQYLCTTKQLYYPGIIYLFGLFILLFYFRKEFVESTASFFLKLFALATTLFVVYWLHLIFQIPKVFFHLQFFSPEYFGLSNWLPSLGDYVLFAMFFFFWMYNFATDLDIQELHEDSKLSRKFVITLLLLFAASLYLLVNYYIQKLILNSTLSFSFNKITEISAQSVLGIFAVGLLLLAVLFFTIRINLQAKNDFKYLEFAGIVLLIVVFLALIQLISVHKIYYTVLVFFIVSANLAILFGKNYLQKFTLSYLIIFVSVTAIYSLLIIYHTTIVKERGHQKLLAVTLVAEHDPAAEVFLTEIQEQIRVDENIMQLLFEDRDKAQERIENYLLETYFNSYFRKYIVDIWVCYPEDKLFRPEIGDTLDCFPFFEDLIKSQGIQIQGTDFYFMDNMNGRISYTGRLKYSSEGSIFINIDSDLLFEGIGFPELLIDKSMMKPDDYKKFSYAKYYGGELTDKYGDYNYNSYVDRYLELSSDDDFSFITDQEYTFKKWDGMEHLIYNTREDNYVIVSRELFTIVDYLISFPYLFVFYFLSVMVLLLIGSKSIRKRRVNFDLKFKIQAAIISIVFVSLLVVALATIFYNIDRYKTKHRNDLDEKMKSIAEEIDMRLEAVNEITDDLQDWMDNELTKLSNIFRTDVNIYGNDGSLISSSRFEIYNRGLVSTRINAQAYYEILGNFQISYFQPERIGELSYLSAYRPIVNYRGDYLGIINLPYFIRQDNYSQEISTFIVAFINLYVLLLLASIIVAVFISNQITRPLVVIQENLQKMELGKQNKPIVYSRQDEIGSLVKEYNKKVEELAISADLLARSERESAWREMAKQIAHEIKNPLTPMKLNIQHLQRTKGEGKEYNEYIERVTATLIEQIDNLSNIATEFSNFAKIPTARNQVFKLAEQLHKVLALFETHEDVSIEFNSNGLENLMVHADREQLSRAIINLVKNGIQSVPETRKGKINILLNRREHMAVVSVSDNGTGVPVELREKLFSPSFTTKSSGMGLGLAIVKNIVENFSGKVWFETKMGKGTTFFIEIPVYSEEKQIS